MNVATITYWQVLLSVEIKRKNVELAKVSELLRTTGNMLYVHAGDRIMKEGNALIVLSMALMLERRRMEER